MFNELLGEFRGRPVVDFQDAASWAGPGSAYRLREEYEDERSIADRLATLVEQPGCQELSSLIIGAWSGACEGGESSQIVQDLAVRAAQLPGLRHLFLGEMTYEECEISWINQSDVSPLLRAFPRLASLRVRGGNGLAFSKIRHDNLEELAIETGGLSCSTIQQLLQCEFPSLEHLELLLGEENYGFDGGVDDLQPLLSGKLFPKLKYLGLMNSVIANDIAAALVDSPITGRVESIDLSLGNLDDNGVKSLIRLSQYNQIRRLNISHHYASESAVAALMQALPFQVFAAERQDPDDEWRPIVHAE
jgi:hypothetical protein